MCRKQIPTTSNVPKTMNEESEYITFGDLHRHCFRCPVTTHTREIQIMLPEFSISDFLRVGVRASRRRRCAKG